MNWISFSLLVISIAPFKTGTIVLIKDYTKCLMSKIAENFTFTKKTQLK
jgi:hypothetical protein